MNELMLSINFRIILGISLFGIIINKVSSQPLETWEIQGSGVDSPYAFEALTTEENVVTAKSGGFFFLQTPAARTDNNPLTSDAILVNAAYSGQAGDVVSVTGRVLETDGTTSISPSGIVVAFIAGGAALPPTWN